jgi:hypothetical protein
MEIYNERRIVIIKKLQKIEGGETFSIQEQSITLSDPMSKPLYTCTESALMISPFNLSAKDNEIAVLPTAVGPVMINTLGLVLGELGGCRGESAAVPDMEDVPVNSLY